MTGSAAPPVLATSSEAARLADQLERAFRGGAWHGPAFAEVLAGVDAAAAERYPIPGGHSIAEIVFHVGYWIEAARLSIVGQPLPAGPEDADWQAPHALDAVTWRALVGSVEAGHRALHSAVVELPDERLGDPIEGSDPTLRGMLLGLLQHTAYHAGQIALLRRADAALRNAAEDAR